MLNRLNMITNAPGKPNRFGLKTIVLLMLLALATIEAINERHNAQQIAEFKKQAEMLQSLMMAHNPPWTNVQFTAIPMKHIIIANGTVENQTELDELRRKLINSGAPVDVNVFVIDTNTVK